MSYSFLPFINPPHFPIDLPFAFPDITPFNPKFNGLESPPSPQENSPKDWMDNVLAFENINKIGLMNVLKVGTGVQPLYHEQSRLQELIRLQQLSHHMMEYPKLEEKIEPGLGEGVIYKKVKVESDGTSVNSEPVMLSSVVDQQLQKLPKCISEKVQRMLSQPKMEKVIKSEQKSSVTKCKNLKKIEEQPLKIIAFKFDEIKKKFLYQVQWKENANRNKPKYSFLTKEEVMEMDPNLIVSYYEEQIARQFKTVVVDQ